MCSNAFKHLRSLGVSNARSSISAGPMRPVRTRRPRPYAPRTRHAEFEQMFERRLAAHYRRAMTSKQEPTETNLAELPDGPPDATGLTPRQQRILAHLRDCIEKRGYPPSMREIGSAVGLTSTSSVAHQLKVLEQKGFIKRDPHRPRALEVFLPEVLAARKAISSADAPMEICEDTAAVMTPPSRRAFRPAIFSRVVSGRAPSSLESPAIGAISRSK